jgi:hypothetical protein
MFQTSNTLSAINRRQAGRSAARRRTRAAGRRSSPSIAAIEPLDSRVLLSAYYVSAAGSDAALEDAAESREHRPPRR